MSALILSYFLSRYFSRDEARENSFSMLYLIFTELLSDPESRELSRAAIYWDFLFF